MPYNQKSKEATMRYIQNNKERVSIWVRKGEADRLRACVIKNGYSAVSRFIIDAINEKAQFEVLTMPQEKGIQPITAPQELIDEIPKAEK